jgi:hypothetical protein
MTGLDHITAGRTTIRALLVAVLLTAAIGAAGTASANVIDGKGNDVLVGTGDDAVAYAFPINNVTVFGYRMVAAEPRPSVPASDATSASCAACVALVPSQDMDPY